MKVSRTEKRLIIWGAHEFFVENRELWIALRNGDVIEVPDDQFDSVKKIFGDTIKIASGRKKKAVSDEIFTTPLTASSNEKGEE